MALVESTTAEPLHGNSRDEFTGTFVRINEGWNSYLNIPELRVVLEDIDGPNCELLQEKQSFHFGKRFRALGMLFPGDRVVFYARIVLSKGGVFKLSRPTKVHRADGWTQTQLV